MRTDAKNLTGKKFICKSLKEGKYKNWSNFFRVGESYEETMLDKAGLASTQGLDEVLLLEGFMGVGFYVDAECFELVSVRHQICMN